MSQPSDAHSVSSGLSNNSNSIQKATSASVVSSSSSQQQQPPPLPVPMAVQNPFERLSSAAAAPTMPSSTSSSSSTATLGTTNLPPSHVAVRMPQPPSTTTSTNNNMRMMPQPSPMKTGTMTSLSMSTPPPSAAATTSTGIPIMGTHSNVSIPVIPSQLPFSSPTTSIPSPIASPPPPMNPSFPSSSNNNNNFPMYEHPSQPIAGNNAVFTTSTNHNDFIFDDDENTVPSSLGNTTDDQLSQQQQYYRRNHPHSNHPEFDPASLPTTIGSSSFTARIIESTKRFITASGSSHDLNPDHHNTTTTTPILTATSVPPNTAPTSRSSQSQQPCLISGYLQKLGRNQKWQTRWFETNGIYLSYYKSSKRSNLLATLDLQKVGLIEIDTDDKTEHSFRIQVLGRLYQLRANSRASCQDWVITLNRVKEARMQQGNVKLVGVPTNQTSSSTTKGPAAITTTIANTALDLLNPNTPSMSSQQKQQQQQQVMHNDSENFLDGTPRVVVVSNRERTHGVDEEEQWDQLIRIDDDIIINNGTFNDTDIDPAASQVETIYSGSSKRLSSIGTVVAARWTKHQSKMQRLGNKLSKWARSVKKYSCTDNDAVIVTSNGRPHGDVVHLDKYLHPPGHDDKRHKQQQQQHMLSKMQSLSMPTTSNTTSSTPLPATSTATSSVLPTTTAATSTLPVQKPLAIRDRTISSASDYDARMLS